MPKIHYKVVPHDGGWAYTLGGTFSEPFLSHADALEAARMAAREQHTPGKTTYIEFEDANGVWHTELAKGGDRPDADVTG